MISLSRLGLSFSPLEIFNRLVAEIEAKARFEPSIKLSGISNAPLGVVRRLAEDDDIFVARPILEHSERLADPDLLNVARTKSQLHLLAISNRNRIAETITDVLVRRGDREVVRNVAGNSGACLSKTGFSTLVRKPEILDEKVGQRSDIPQQYFHQLFIQATHIVQKRLLATVTPETQGKIRRVLADIFEQFTIDMMSAEDFTTLERRLVKPVASEFGLYILINVFRCHKISIAAL